MRYPIAMITLAVAFPLLGGCGQTGPLYLPDQEAQQSKPAEQAKSPQTQTEAP